MCYYRVSNTQGYKGQAWEMHFITTMETEGMPRIGSQIGSICYQATAVRNTGGQIKVMPGSVDHKPNMHHQDIPKAHQVFRRKYAQLV